jgi:hypothetical protein
MYESGSPDVIVRPGLAPESNASASGSMTIPDAVSVSAAFA